MKFKSTICHIPLISHTFISTPTSKTSISILIFPKIIIVRISKYLQMILDAGSTQHMIGDINMCLVLVIQSMFPSNQVLCLIDEVTTLPICGVDTIRLKIDIYILEIENVLYGPRLKDTIFSITEHIKYNNCSFIGSNTNTR